MQDKLWFNGIVISFAPLKPIWFDISTYNPNINNQLSVSEVFVHKFARKYSEEKKTQNSLGKMPDLFRIVLYKNSVVF